MLTEIQQLTYAIVLCEDMDRMKAFYRDLFSFPVELETDTSLSFRVGAAVSLALRKRTRDYDGRGAGAESPGCQLAFRVSPDEVSHCYDELVEKGVKILDPPADQPRGHRTVYFADPEGNILEVFAEI
jgi:catechol 2,3-dioxygenase-like lactoylglutathione lyase family enzyme